MAKLELAKNADFDKMFLDMMIKHHGGAIDMANIEVQNGNSSEAKEQAQQITEMKGFLTAGADR